MVDLKMLVFSTVVAVLVLNENSLFTAACFSDVAESPNPRHDIVLNNGPPSRPASPVNNPPRRVITTSYGMSTSNGMGRPQQAWYRRRGLPIPTANRYARDYVSYRGIGTYKVHYWNTLPWIEALHVCASEGSILAVINNEAEAELIKSLIGPSIISDDNHKYWVGAKEFGRNRTYYTLHGGILGTNNSHLRWALDTEPHINHVHENCVGFINNDKTYFVEDCNESFKFVCEKVT